MAAPGAFFTMKAWKALALYAFADGLCIAAGMGVPIFCILLGFPVGWYAARRLASPSGEIAGILKGTILYAALASAVTCFAMAALWLPTAARLSGPPTDIANFGIPMILYEPRASFVAWLVLMIAIAPALQLLAAVFAAHATLWQVMRRDNR